MKRLTKRDMDQKQISIEISLGKKIFRCLWNWKFEKTKTKFTALNFLAFTKHEYFCGCQFTAVWDLSKHMKTWTKLNTKKSFLALNWNHKRFRIIWMSEKVGFTRNFLKKFVWKTLFEVNGIWRLIKKKKKEKWYAFDNISPPECVFSVSFTSIEKNLSFLFSFVKKLCFYRYYYVDKAKNLRRHISVMRSMYQRCF